MADLFDGYRAAMDDVRKGATGPVDLFAGTDFKPSNKRSWGQALADTGVQLAEGAVNLAGAVPNLIAPESSIASAINDFGDDLRESQSGPMLRRVKEAEAKIAAADQDSVIAQAAAALQAYGADPALISRLVATNLPSMVPGMAAAKGAQAASLAAGASRAAAATHGAVAAGGVNAVLNAGGARGEAYDDLKQTLQQQGYNEQEASALALEKSRLPAAVGGVAGAISGPTGLERVLVGRGLAAGGGKAAAKAVGAELGGELLEEGAPQVATNYQAGEYDGRPLQRDMGRTLVETAFASAPGAGLAGAGAYFNRESEAGTPAEHQGVPSVPEPSQATPSLNTAGTQGTQEGIVRDGQERNPLHPEGDPLALDEATAGARLAELEVIAGVSGLNPDQERERLLLVHRIDELEQQANSYQFDELAPAQEIQAQTNAASALDASESVAKTIAPEDLPDAGEDVPATPAEVRAKTWPQFVTERGYKVEDLRKGTADWSHLQTEWAAVKTHRAGLQPDGSGAAAEPTQEIQNRDRSRPASVMQMQAMATKPDYGRLGISRTPESGAPMVFAVSNEQHAAHALGTQDVAVMSDGQRVPFRYAVMEAADVQPSNFADGAVNPQFDAAHPGTVKALNNGRTAGVRAAYERGTAESYKQELMADSVSHGIDAAVIASMRSPMLVRLYSEEDNRHNMGAKSQSQALGLSPSEQAATDAVLLDAGMLDAFDAGPLDGVANADFVRGFVGRLQGAGQDVAGMMDAGGRVSPAGVQRLQAALVHKAFDDGDLVETMFGSQDNDIRAIGEALKDVAGQWAYMRHMAQAGAINRETDVTPYLLQAIRLVQKARRDRSALVDLANQVDIETGQAVEPIAVEMLRLLYSGEYLTRARGRDAVADALRMFTTAALVTSGGADMFGEVVGPGEILSALTGSPLPVENVTNATTNASTQHDTAGSKQSGPTAAGQTNSEHGQPTGGDVGGGSAGQAGEQERGSATDGSGAPADEDGRRSGGQDAQYQIGQQAGQGDQGTAQDGRSTVESATPELELDSYTPGEASAKQEAEAAAAKAQADEQAKAEKAAKAERERKEIAARQDASAENFQLGQDPMDSLIGQQSVFDTPDATNNKASESNQQKISEKKPSEVKYSGGQDAIKNDKPANAVDSDAELNAMFEELMAEEGLGAELQSPSEPTAEGYKVGDTVVLGAGRVKTVIKSIEGEHVHTASERLGLKKMHMDTFRERLQAAKDAAQATATTAPDSWRDTPAKTRTYAKGLIDAGQLDADKASDVWGDHGALLALIDGKGEAPTAAQALSSAAKNTADALTSAIDGLGALFGGGPGRLGSGLSFDEDTYAKAKPMFAQAAKSMGAAGQDLREAMRAIIRMVSEKFGPVATRNMQPYIVRYIKEQSTQAAKQESEQDNAPSTDASVERNSPEPAPVSADAGAVQRPGAAISEDGAQASGSAVRDGGPGQRDDASISVDTAALLGKRSDQQLHRGEPADGPADSTAGADRYEGVPDAGSAGISPEPVAADQVAKIADSAVPKDQRASNSARKQLSSQARTYELGSPEHTQSVREAAPQLLPGQVDDVVKAEMAFAKPDGHGMLLTNGTGTGKTFSGLGTMRRFVDAGKDNILVVVPDDKIAGDWIDSGKLLGLDITQLATTKDAGKSVTITTYANVGDNAALLSRQWDLVVPDEAHTLMSNQDGGVTRALQAVRALTYHPDGLWHRQRMLHGDMMDEARTLSEQAQTARGQGKPDVALENRAAAMHAELASIHEAMKVEFATAAKEGKRTKLLALSATPFAYEKNIEWAEGYLFSYDEGQSDESREFRGYNSGGNRERFFMQHFGYRMRYNKLTQPEAGVDSNVMQRQFNTWLRKRGVLSSRQLDVAADYDRRFVLFEDAMGRRIDEALGWLAEKSNDSRAFGDLAHLVNKSLDYQTRRYLLEAMKAQEAVKMAREHMAVGRKVIVFHDYIKGGGTNPFAINLTGVDAEKHDDVANALALFNQEFGDLQRANLHLMPSPIQAFTKAFGDELLLVNGQVKPKRKVLQAYKTFNDDAAGPRVMLVQSAKDKGWSGHDTTGKHQRVLINLGLPTAPTKAIQIEGRPYRTGVVSDVLMRYLNTGTSWERYAFASTIATRSATAENLSMGEEARALQDAFVSAFEDSQAWPVGHEGEGKGGKESDRARNNVITEWDRAKTMYWSQEKKTQKTKAREGADYFATPEPLGLKMVEWAGVVPGDDSLEPSAGHGAIARWLPTTGKRTMVEPSPELRSRLALAGFSDKDRIVASTFEDLDIGNKYDVITMNPPFGTAGRTAVDHIAKAYRHLREGGRLVALLPQGSATDKFEKWMYEKADKADKDGNFPYTKPELHYTAEVLLPGVAFSRAGAGVVTRVVVLDKLAKDQTGVPFARRDLSRAADVQEFFDRLQGIELPQRAKAKEFEAARAKEIADAPKITRTHDASTPASADAVTAATNQAAQAVAGNDGEPKLQRGGRPWSNYTTRKGKVLRGVVVASKEEAEKFDAYTFKHEGGFFVRDKHVAETPEPPVFQRVSGARGNTGSELQQLVEQAEDIAQEMVKAWPNAGPIKVVASMNDPQTPKAVRDWDAVMKAEGATGDGTAFFYKGITYLVAAQLRTPKDVATAVTHEILGHRGLRGMFGSQLSEVLEQIAKARPEQVAQIAKNYGVKLDSHAQRLAMAEEVLAFMAQETPHLGFVKRAIAAVRTWLRKHLPRYKDMALTDEEIINSYILPARAWVQGQARSMSPREWVEPRFMRADSGDADIQFLRLVPGQVAQVAQSKLQAAAQKVSSLTSRSALDKLIYDWQDRFIDLKRIQQHIRELGGTVSEVSDGYLGEELYHKRVAKRSANFLRDELRPLLAGVNKSGVGLEAFESFLHARHAVEANAVMAERNPNQQTIDDERKAAKQQVDSLRKQLQRAMAQGGAVTSVRQSLADALIEQSRWDGAEAFDGTEEERLSLSGMSDQEATTILNGYPAAQRAQLDALAAQVDAISDKTLQELEGYGLMDSATLNAWRSTYKHYVPLHRDEAHPNSKAHPIGQGFSTKGDASKQRTGSNEKVTNILSHIAMQREAALTRGEKNNVAKRLYVLAAQNPDPELWSTDAPKKKEIDSETGLVRTVTDRGALMRDNVLMVRVGGKDKFLIFNEKNETTMRLAIAMRNLDATELDRFSRTMGHLTRWFASVNTQYNPVFSVFNFARDVQGAMLQLSTTPLKGKEAEVLKGVKANVWQIYKELREQRKSGAVGQGYWAKLWEQMGMDGGMTGFRDLYVDPADRKKALQKALDMESAGKVKRAAHGLFDWLSDFNESLEGTVRLATYKVAIDQGLTRQQAASTAKNITVNFNRRGRNMSVVGSYYAFMNAAIQGNVRMVQTLNGPRGRQIMAGGVALGMLSALAGTLFMGGDGADDEWARVPEFVKERSIVIPLGPKDYVSIPMPLGFHVFPNIGRKFVEAALHADPHKSRMSYVGELALIAANAYNPMGGTENFWQMLAPTPIDPVVALMENKDWTGKAIYKEQRSGLDPKPGHAMAKDSTTGVAKAASEFINAATGGNEWRPGFWSPNPDAIEYLFGQFTGGVGRELAKAGNAVQSGITGEELAPHQIPLVGRVYGSTSGINGQNSEFYENIKRINVSMAEAKARVERGEESGAVLQDVPLAPLDTAAGMVDKRVRDLVKARNALQRSDDPQRREKIERFNEEIEAAMYRLNAAVAERMRLSKADLQN